MWLEPDVTRNNFLWLTVPINGNKPGETNAISVSHPHGTNARAQSNVQHENALLYLCDTTLSSFNYALCYVPGGWLAMHDDAEKSGRVYLHYGSVLIAMISSQPFKWDRSAGLKAPAVKPRAGDSEFRIEGSHFAAAIETASPDEFPEANPAQRLRAFVDVMEQKAALILEDDPRLKASYKARTGVVISRVFQAEASINGDRVDADHWPMLQSPWISQPSHDSNLSITDGKRTRVYDFKSWQVADA
jgi:hypothetical protein